MTAENFAYWLQGFFEITGNNDKGLTSIQTDMIQRHLNMVFIHDIDPKMGDKKYQLKLSEAHNNTEESLKFPMSGEEALAKWGNCPKPGYVLSYMYGWYDPTKGTPKC